MTQNTNHDSDQHIVPDLLGVAVANAWVTNEKAYIVGRSVEVHIPGLQSGTSFQQGSASETLVNGDS